MAILTGLARLAREGNAALVEKRVGLICNPTSVDGELNHAIDILRGKGVNLTALFGPEHGAKHNQRLAAGSQEPPLTGFIR